MNKIKTDWEIHFSLSEKIDCESNIPIREDVLFDTEIGKSNQYSIKGFTIKINDVSEEDVMQSAQKQARILTDILAVTSGTSSEPRMDATRVKQPTGGFRVSKTFTIKYAIRSNADLSMPEARLTNLLNGKDPELNQQMQYINKAMNALKSNDSASAIKDLYLACNQNPQGNLAKYKALRNALSHDPVFPHDIQRIKRDFGADYFDFTQENRFDYASHKNQKHLMDEAQNFLNQTRSDVSTKIISS